MTKLKILERSTLFPLCRTSLFPNTEKAAMKMFIKKIELLINSAFSIQRNIAYLNYNMWMIWIYSRNLKSSGSFNFSFLSITRKTYYDIDGQEIFQINRWIKMNIVYCTSHCMTRCIFEVYLLNFSNGLKIIVIVL